MINPTKEQTIELVERVGVETTTSAQAAIDAFNHYEQRQVPMRFIYVSFDTYLKHGLWINPLSLYQASIDFAMGRVHESTSRVNDEEN